MKALAWMFFAILLVSCKVETSEEKQKKIDEFVAAVRAEQEPYMKTIDAFLDATSKKDFDRAYGLGARKPR